MYTSGKSMEAIGALHKKFSGRGVGKEDSAMKLGAAFQKINFLRDLNADYFQLGRTYFPEMNFDLFDCAMKTKIPKLLSGCKDTISEANFSRLF